MLVDCCFAAAVVVLASVTYNTGISRSDRALKRAVANLQKIKFS